MVSTRPRRAERTTEAMELVLKAWTEPQPFGWQGRHFQFRTVAVWPRPTQQPHPPTYALGTSRESCEFAARHRLGLGASYAPFEVVAKATRYYRDACAGYGWQPAPEQIIYRANILMAETDEEARELLEAARRARTAFAPRPRVRDALLQLDSAQHRRRSADTERRRRAADELPRRAGYGRRADQALPRARRGRASST